MTGGWQISVVGIDWKEEDGAGEARGTNRTPRTKEEELTSTYRRRAQKTLRAPQSLHVHVHVHGYMYGYVYSPALAIARRHSSCQCRSSARRDSTVGSGRCWSRFRSSASPTIVGRQSTTTAFPRCTHYT